MCDGCRQGAHCGPPGVAGPSCTCQHRPRRGDDAEPLVITTEEVKIMDDAVRRLTEAADPEASAALRDCTDDCCPGDTCRLDAARARLTAAGDTGGAGHPGRPTPTPEAPPETVIGDARGFVSVLTEWMREHRAGHFDTAAVLRRRLVAYLGRMGGNNDVGGVDRV